MYPVVTMLQDSVVAPADSCTGRLSSFIALLKMAPEAACSLAKACWSYIPRSRGVSGAANVPTGSAAITAFIWSVNGIMLVLVSWH